MSIDETNSNMVVIPFLISKYNIESSAPPAAAPATAAAPAALSRFFPPH